MSAISYKIPSQDNQVRDIVGQIPQFDGKGTYLTGIVMSYFAQGDLIVVYSDHKYNRRFELHSSYGFVGHIVFNCRRKLEDETFGDESAPLARYNPGITYRLVNKVSHIYVNKIEVDKQWQNSGFGTLLLRLSMEWGMARGCGARTLLNAYKNSHWWYHQLGFRVAETYVLKETNFVPVGPATWVDGYIESEIKRAKEKGETPNTTSLSANHHFSLPEDACQKWVAMIQAKPLLTHPFK